MSNSGYVDVDTQPATATPVQVANLGTFSPGAGPTVAPDGMVVLGNLEGQVIALHEDGSPYWNRQLPHPQSITASPVIGRDGSIYVVGSWTATDHRDGADQPVGYGWLHRFTSDGGAPVTGVVAFPQSGPWPMAIGAPNIWGYGSDEAILVPAWYPFLNGGELKILAFSPNGELLTERTEDVSFGDVTSDSGPFDFLDFLAAPFTPGSVQPPANPPFPGVAIAPNPQGGTPFVVLIDGISKQTIAYAFCVGSSCVQPGFVEAVRINHAPRQPLSSGTVLPSNNSTMVGTDDGVVFGGPSPANLLPITGLGMIVGAPTLTVDGRAVIVNVDAEVIGLQGQTIVSRVSLSGRTIARAAASRNHVFVSTTDGLHTLDADAAAFVATFPLAGGGIWPPAIGPQGRVYALAANVLQIFPPTNPHRPPGVVANQEHPGLKRP